MLREKVFVRHILWTCGEVIEVTFTENADGTEVNATCCPRVPTTLFDCGQGGSDLGLFIDLLVHRTESGAGLWDISCCVSWVISGTSTGLTGGGLQHVADLVDVGHECPTTAVSLSSDSGRAAISSNGGATKTSSPWARSRRA